MDRNQQTKFNQIKNQLKSKTRIAENGFMKTTCDKIDMEKGEVSMKSEAKVDSQEFLDLIQKSIEGKQMRDFFYSNNVEQGKYFDELLKSFAKALIENGAKSGIQSYDAISQQYLKELNQIAKTQGIKTAA